MQEPFSSIPLIWIIQEDTLGKRLPVYEEMGWKHLISHWKNALGRANVIVFPDFTLPVDLSSCLNFKFRFHLVILVLDFLIMFLKFLFLSVSDVI